MSVPAETQPEPLPPCIDCGEEQDAYDWEEVEEGETPRCVECEKRFSADPDSPGWEP